MKTKAVLTAIGLGFVTTVLASPEWFAVSLHPTGAPSSRLTCISDDESGGYTGDTFYYGSNRQAVKWENATAQFVNLYDISTRSSWVNGVGGGMAVGETISGGNSRASLWDGNTSSYVHLDPKNSVAAEAFGISGAYQTGSADFLVGLVAKHHAGTWKGDSKSWVDLNPAGADSSVSYAIGSGTQAGYATFGTSQHAGWWSGTAGSFVDLHPTGYTMSTAYAIRGGQQAGATTVANSSHHAAIWSGTPESFVDLNPANSSYSEAHGVAAGIVVGFATFSGHEHAVAWLGGQHQLVDLQPVVPFVSDSSHAMAVDVDAQGQIWVAGYAHNYFLSREEAIRWHLDANPSPVEVSGRLTLQDFGGSLQAQTLNVDLLQDGSVVESHSTNAHADGTYSLSTSLRGPVVLRAKASHWLAKQVSGYVNITDGGASGIDLSLVNGDVDGDNQVSVFDYNALSAAFDSTSADPNWNPNADLDGDGTVTVFDYNIFSANMDQFGD